MDEATGVSLPDMSSHQFTAFMSRLWKFGDGPGDGEDIKTTFEIITQPCMDEFFDHTIPTKAQEPLDTEEYEFGATEEQVKIKHRKPRARDPGPKPHTKKVELVTKRTSLRPGLRTKIKRARFEDQVDPLRVRDDGELVSDSVPSELVDITGVNLPHSERTDESKALTSYTNTELDSKENYFPCTRCGKMLKNGPSLRVGSLYVVQGFFKAFMLDGLICGKQKPEKEVYLKSKLS